MYSSKSEQSTLFRSNEEKWVNIQISGFFYGTDYESGHGPIWRSETKYILSEDSGSSERRRIFQMEWQLSRFQRSYEKRSSLTKKRLCNREIIQSCNDDTLNALYLLQNSHHHDIHFMTTKITKIWAYKLVEIAAIENIGYQTAMRRKKNWDYIQIISWTWDQKKQSCRYIPSETSKIIKEAMFDRNVIEPPATNKRIKKSVIL